MWTGRPAGPVSAVIDPGDDCCETSVHVGQPEAELMPWFVSSFDS